MEHLNLPKVNLGEEEITNEAAYKLFKNMVKSTSLLFVSCPFFFRAMTHSASLEEKEDLSVKSIRKLTAENCNLDSLLMKDDVVKDEVQRFIDHNPRLWIKYEEPIKKSQYKKYSICYDYQ